MGLRWKTDTRPQRHGWAPGEYVHGKCRGEQCKDLEDSSWVGAKRAIMCADCAYAMPWPPIILDDIDQPARPGDRERVLFWYGG